MIHRIQRANTHSNAINSNYFQWSRLTWHCSNWFRQNSGLSSSSPSASEYNGFNCFSREGVSFLACSFDHSDSHSGVGFSSCPSYESTRSRVWFPHCSSVEDTIESVLSCLVHNCWYYQSERSCGLYHIHTITTHQYHRFETDRFLKVAISLSSSSLELKYW